MFKIRDVLVAAAATLTLVAGPQAATAADMVITSEIAATHWKAAQMDALAAEITKRTEGRINAQVYHAGTLYKDKAALAALSTGAVNMVWPVSFWMENINPAYGVIGLPFSVTDKAMLDWDYRSEMTKFMSSMVEDKGLVVLGLARTSEALFLSKEPIQTVDDLKDRKIRVPSGKVLHSLMEGYGASPITMATTEIATALAQGAIDQIFTSPGGWQMVGTQASHGTVVPGMLISTYSVVVDRNWLESLDPQDREAVISATEDAMTKQWKPAMEEDQKALDSMVAKGGKATRLGEDASAEFKRLAAPVIEAFREQYPEAVAKFEAIGEKHGH